MHRDDVLLKAWQEGKTNAGSAGVDEQTIRQMAQRGVTGFLSKVATELHQGTTDRTRAAQLHYRRLELGGRVRTTINS